MSCFITHYASPLGRLLLAADEEGLTGLWLEGQKYFAAGLPQQREEQRTPALEEACRWLDTYFTGREPDFTPPLHPVGSDFQRAVWQLLLQIPYGQTTTYGALAGELARQRGLTHFSAQAVGGARTSLADIVAATEDWGGTDFNPHASHVGKDVQCGDCHSVHRESELYCNQCHNATLPEGWVDPS